MNLEAISNTQLPLEQEGKVYIVCLAGEANY